MAGRQGFEPRYRGPEPRVLPLDDLPVPLPARTARTVDYSQSKNGLEGRPGAACFNRDPVSADDPTTNPQACSVCDPWSHGDDDSPCRPFDRLRAPLPTSTHAPCPSHARPGRLCSQSPSACRDPSTQIRDPLSPRCPPPESRPGFRPTAMRCSYSRCPPRARTGLTCKRFHEPDVSSPVARDASAPGP